MTVRTSIFVVSSGNPARCHTLRLLEKHEIDFRVVVHDNNAGTVLSDVVKPSRIIVSHTKTLVEKRNFILNELVHDGHWFVGIDDNIQHFTAVQDPWITNNENPVDAPPPDGHTWRGIYNQQIDPRLWLNVLGVDIMRADQAGVPLVGVATMENPFFRARRFSNYRFVKTKVFAMKNMRDLRFKHEMCHDSYITALAVKKYGKVLVDSYLHHKTKMYEKGGLGNREEREAKGLLAQTQSICDEFPGLVVPGRGQNTALCFRLVTEKGVEKWRADVAKVR